MTLYINIVFVYLIVGMIDISVLDQQIVWHPYSPLNDTVYPEVIRAEGTRLFLKDGSSLLDGIASWWVAVHGHAQPELVKALSHQAEQLDHVLFAGFTHAPAVSLANKILSLLGKHQARVFYSDNGSTAVEVALKWALQFYLNNKERSRTKFLAIEGAFHGDTFGAMSVSGRGLFTDPYQSILSEVDFIPFPTEENKDMVLEQFETLCATRTHAAFIFEPLVQGASGMRMYSASILDSCMDIAARYDVLTIADEVMTGFGKTGTLFAVQQVKHSPDMVCLSKALTGGLLPLGVTTCNSKIEAAFYHQPKDKMFFHGHTFTANPIICHLASVNLDLIAAPHFMENIQRIERAHQRFVQTYQANYTDVVESIQCLGIILKVEFIFPGGYLSSIRDRMYTFFYSRGILLRPLGNVVYFLPPVIITDEELNFVYETIIQCIEEFQNLE